MVSDIRKKDNIVLVDFDFVIDRDIGVFNFIKSSFSNSPYINKKLLSMGSLEVKYYLMNRLSLNPLEIIFLNIDTKKLYEDLMSAHYLSIMNLSEPYDVFFLLKTMLDNASSLDIFVRCDNKYESDYIKKNNSEIKTIIAKPDEIDLDNYTALYLKSHDSITKYGIIEGKHIYLANARYNMRLDDENFINVMELYSKCNSIHYIDQFVNIKFNLDDDGFKVHNIEPKQQELPEYLKIV